MQQDPKRNTRPDARNAKIASQNPKQHNSPADCSNPLLCTQDTLFYEGTLCKCTHITASEYCKYFLHFCGSTDNTCYKVIVAADLLCPLRSMYSTKPFDNQHQNLNIPAESWFADDAIRSCQLILPVYLCACVKLHILLAAELSGDLQFVMGRWSLGDTSVLKLQLWLWYGLEFRDTAVLELQLWLWYGLEFRDTAVLKLQLWLLYGLEFRDTAVLELQLWLWYGLEFRDTAVLELQLWLLYGLVFVYCRQKYVLSNIDKLAYLGS